MVVSHDTRMEETTDCRPSGVALKECSSVTYQPAPIEISHVTLPPAIRALTEKLAENAHDLWALQRMGEGWTYGSKRDDYRKQHPCLVPYDQLPESEKEYDRIMAMKTLKAILALGYRIEKSV